MKQEKGANSVVNEKSILLEDWEDRDKRLNGLFNKNVKYIKTVDSCIDIWQKLTNICKDEKCQKLLFEYDSQLNYQEAIVQGLSYKQGYKDGIRAIIESLQST